MAGNTRKAGQKTGKNATPKTKAGKASETKSREAASGKKPTRPRCKICDKPIHVPTGWTRGPAVRRHYWAKHREVMQGKGRKS